MGAGGAPTGITETSADAALVPIAFVAFTLHKYVAPLVRLVTEIGLALFEPVRVVWPDDVHVAVYDVTVAPPFEFAVNAMLAVASPGVAAPIVGALGVVAGVTFVLLDAVLVPIALVATTLQEYWVPLVIPVTLIGLVAPLPVAVVWPAAVHVAV